MFKLTTRLFRSFSTVKRLRNIVPTCSPRFTFSTAKPSQIESPLARILEQEIEYEKENAPNSDALLNMIQKQGWNITSNDTLIEMKKQQGDKTINVVFLVEPLRPEQEVNNADSNAVEGFGQYLQFTAYVQKQNDPKILYADFLSNQQQTRIINLNFTQDINSHKLLSKHNRSLTSYQGPDIYTLDNQILTNINEYFEELGINNQLVAFIQEYSKNSEHPFYVQWLDDLYNFVK